MTATKVAADGSIVGFKHIFISSYTENGLRKAKMRQPSFQSGSTVVIRVMFFSVTRVVPC